MVRVRVEAHGAVARTGRGILALAAKAGDEPTADLLT
jgi:starvation-inducible DNA-binding protein